jgi:hypothetical protein
MPRIFLQKVSDFNLTLRKSSFPMGRVPLDFLFSESRDPEQLSKNVDSGSYFRKYKEG